VALSSVPNKGLYPLGLGGEVRENTALGVAKVSIDNHFLEQQKQLRERFITLGLGPPPDSEAPNQVLPTPEAVVKDTKLLKKGNAGGSKKAPPTTITNSSTSISAVVVKDFAPTVFESRQFDFRSNSNPLFGPLSEYDRIALLGQVHGGSTAGDLTTSMLTETNREIKVIQTSRQNHPICTCKPLKIDKLSLSKMRSELLSYSSVAIASFSSAAASAEQHGDKVVVCSPVSIAARCGEGDLGDGDVQGDKPSQDRRKVFSKDEVEKLSKAELAAELREVLRHCNLCVTNQCECYQLGTSWCVETVFSSPEYFDCANGESVFLLTQLK
jgi:hypothetical protein